MRIEHVALWTGKLENMKRFYEELFGGKVSSKYVNPKTNFESYFIAFESGAKLEIMKKPSLLMEKSDSDGQNPGYAHIAFSLGSKEKVDAMTEQLRNKGFQVVSEPRTTGDGCYESCILDPDGNRVEITE
ncbi:VOC family protein [Pelosinus sp. UFO1]|uniref:VOC family protein n=1 Tax=Pelosinus sp. UFO1 TaxID=484770 RepID=UPI0004D0D55C|nr:VOC family protein [Pelosinus sp. UFO1]AIF53170.1 Glyoxalase-like domain containing protein [Pelosinus sp. UFO1]